MGQRTCSRVISYKYSTSSARPRRPCLHSYEDDAVIVLRLIKVEVSCWQTSLVRHGDGGVAAKSLIHRSETFAEVRQVRLVFHVEPERQGRVNMLQEVSEEEEQSTEPGEASGGLRRSGSCDGCKKAMRGMKREETRLTLSRIC